MGKFAHYYHLAKAFYPTHSRSALGRVGLYYVFYGREIALLRPNDDGWRKAKLFTCVFQT